MWGRCGGYCRGLFDEGFSAENAPPLNHLTKFYKLPKIKTATMKKTIFTFLAFTLLLSFSCEKQNILNPEPPDELPPATMTGANTFGCLVNGEVWRPYIQDGNIWEKALNVKHDRGWVDCDQLFIGAQRKFHDNGEYTLRQTFAINVWCPVLGVNEITPTNGIFLDFLVQGSCSYKYKVDTLFPYLMNITKLDVENNIASGTFEFTAINNDNQCPDTLRITQGRFDADSRL